MREEGDHLRLSYTLESTHPNVLSPVSLSLLHIHISKFPSQLPSLPHVFPMNLVGEYLSVGLESTRSSGNRAQRQYYMVVKNLNFGPDYLDLNSSTLTYQHCNFGQATYIPCVSASSLVLWR